ncbi:MAG: phenylacetate--CoA ligase, partial [Brevibacterium sp.]|nr:phenylacetate--CoA ligase [Brevibacterium sp.]
MTANDLDPGERMSLDELRADQLANLQTTVTTVYERVPFYRTAFDDLGITPADITSLDDIAKLPFTNKQDLRDNYPFGMFALPREQVARIHASSGTTGLPTVVGYTVGDLDRWGSLVARSILAAGGKRGQMMHNAYGYGLFTGGLGVHGAERHGFTVVPIYGGQTTPHLHQLKAVTPPKI